MNQARDTSLGLDYRNNVSDTISGAGEKNSKLAVGASEVRGGAREPQRSMPW